MEQPKQGVKRRRKVILRRRLLRRGDRRSSSIVSKSIGRGRNFLILNFLLKIFFNSENLKLSIYKLKNKSPQKFVRKKFADNFCGQI
ncbi:unnamed protein product [Meloidogyne enterolobii]|uniref:Uncharacterized protein n=1 Tax=Meloidogyne enterolobii TaxID=390850 RepID=A0ACB1A955_MELEN